MRTELANIYIYDAMTLRHLFPAPLTMNDTNGYEAKCLPVRGTRLNASHAVGLVREPYRTQAISPRATPSRFGAAPSSVTPSLGSVRVGGPAFEAPQTHPNAKRPLPCPTRRVRSTYSLRGSDCPHTLRPREHPGTAPRRASTVHTTRVTTQRCEARCRRSGPWQSHDPPPRFSRRFHRREPKLLHTPLLPVAVYQNIYNRGGETRNPPHDPKAKPPAYTWGVTHSKWNLLRRIEHGNTVTAADRAVCPHGHRSAAQGGGQGAGPTRRGFDCLVCGRRFSQIAPNQLAPGQDPESAWVRVSPEQQQQLQQQQQQPNTGGDYAWLNRRTVQGTPVAGPSRPSVRLPNGLLQVRAVAPPLAPQPQAAPPSQARERGPCVGDTKLIFHNRQGEATDTAMAFESLEHRLLPRAAVVAIAEAGWDAKMIEVVEKRMRTKCHRLYCAPANGRAPRGSVTAIVVRADVEQVEGEGLLWKREDGKALIVAVVLGGTPYYVSAAHYPAAEHDDRERAEFETDLRYEYTKARATHGALHPRWKDAGWLRGSDRNMVDRWGTGLDEQAQRRYSARATHAMNLTRASCNLSDVWTALRPNDPAGLTHGEPGRRRRLDGWEAGTSTIGHELGVVDVRVIPAVQLSVPWKDRKKGLKISDHDAVEVTLRSSTERRPAGEPRIRAGALDIPEVRKYIRQSVAQLKNRPGDAQSRFDLWAADVVSKCHRAYRAQARAAARERTLLERLVRESHGRHDVAGSDEPEAGQLRTAMATCGLTADKTHTLTLCRPHFLCTCM